MLVKDLQSTKWNFPGIFVTTSIHTDALAKFLLLPSQDLTRIAFQRCQRSWFARLNRINFPIWTRTVWLASHAPRSATARSTRQSSPWLPPHNWMAFRVTLAASSTTICISWRTRHCVPWLLAALRTSATTHFKTLPWSNSTYSPLTQFTRLRVTTSSTETLACGHTWLPINWVNSGNRRGLDLLIYVSSSRL